MRFDYYGVSGDKTSGSHTSTGFKAYNEYSLNFNRQNTPFNKWRGQFSGVINQSTYRYSDHGFIPERMVLSHEKGDTSLPYRFDIGDIYTYFSYRTLQRSLKGIQIEFQPFNSKRKESVLFAVGTTSSSWRDFQIYENLTCGMSYLIEDDKLGKYIANFVHNSRKNNAGVAGRLQNIFSIAGEKTIIIGTQNLTVESEIGKFFGDTDAGQDKEETGFYLQINGRSNLPLTYRIKYDAYGKDYAPAGAGVSSNRRSDEENITYQFRTGYQVNLRLQNYKDGWKTNNPTRTKSYGINLSGKFGSLDFFVQDTENDIM